MSLRKKLQRRRMAGVCADACMNHLMHLGAQHADQIVKTGNPVIDPALHAKGVFWMRSMLRYRRIAEGKSPWR